MNFVRQHPLISTIFKILVFQKGPDVLPASQFLLGLLLFLSLAVGIASFIVQFDLPGAITRTLADIFISIGFVYLLLLGANKSARALQTISAMLGVSIILNLISLPLLLMVSTEQAPVGAFAVFLYIIFCWHIAVMGHIFRHALSTSLPVGILVSFVYVLIAMAVFYSLFPVQ